MAKHIKKTIGIGIGFCIFASIFLWSSDAVPIVYLLSYLFIFLITSFFTHKSLLSEEMQAINEKLKVAEKRADAADAEQKLWKTTLLERNSGFKTLLTLISDYEKAKDASISHFLRSKSHPAYKAADVVKEQTQLRRHAEFENKRTQALIEMYEQYAPFLADLKDEIPRPEDERILLDYSDEEKMDEAINYLSKDEYRNLPSIKRNQLALDRFWNRPKSNWFLGKLYERYIGYLYEIKGYQVEYFGISEKYEDMGRDLICHKGNETLIIQCKNWSQFKTIYEKHIFQLFGSVFEYKENHPNRTVSAVFYTTTKLSDKSRKIATLLNVTLFENFRFDKTYPCIKCNISGQSNEKIYHLPFDQKYDDTKIDRKGEKYCATVEEAEAAGFRRAFRWHGDKTSLTV